ncbi:MBL fold metallo-hydrolase [Bacillus haynesii]|uniref:MBL fold metallo-hydrolase n=3 Tax=Bacillus haynesii TaxID=1925021 RepID=UPI0026A1583D
MKWRRMPLGPIQTNAYILSNDDGTCLIFDPGSESGKLNAYIKEKGLKPLAVLLTHAHFDHIGAVDNVRKEWNIPVYVHKNEAEWLTDPSLNGSALLTGQTITAEKADHLIEEERDLKIGPFTTPRALYARAFSGQHLVLCGRGKPDRFRGCFVSRRDRAYRPAGRQSKGADGQYSSKIADASGRDACVKRSRPRDGHCNRTGTKPVHQRIYFVKH